MLQLSVLEIESEIVIFMCPGTYGNKPRKKREEIITQHAFLKSTL